LAFLGSSAIGVRFNMSEFPECPFCEHRLTDAVSPSIEGTVRIRCPACGQQYEFMPEIGSFPLDDDLGIKVSKGILGPHVMDWDSGEAPDVSSSHALLIGGLCCCTIVFIIPVVMALLLALFG
jgi:hypothetical protein